MWSFIVDLLRNAGTERTVVLLDSEDMGVARRYRIRPSRVLVAWGGSLLLMGGLVGLLLAFTPLRKQIPGYGTETIKKSAELNTMRLQSLQDSLAAQRRYVRKLRRLITGQVGSGTGAEAAASAPPSTTTEPARRTRRREEAATDAEGNPHQQPALAPSVVSTAGQGRGDGSTRTGLAFPLPPPVTSGFPTRDFNATTGHYGIDVAVSEGEYIRAVADGYVVWADWAQDGGYTIAVQHTDGYLSVYKHNKRLLKHLGDRVRANEPVAVSGNTGAITTGPHLHFELWRNGLAQAPQSYIAGW